jgi:hypothetical protein
VLVGDDQTHPGQAALFQVGQEATREHLVSLSPTSRTKLPGRRRRGFSVATKPAVGTYVQVDRVDIEWANSVRPL